MRGYVFLSLLIVAFSTTSFLAAVPSVDDFSLDNPFWNGLSTLHQRYGFEYISISNLMSAPPDAIVFIYPSKPISEGQAQTLKAFLEEGGTLIILDEYGYFNTFLNSLGFGANISSYLLRDPLYKWKSSELPYSWVDFGGKSFKICLNYASALDPGNGKTLGFSSYFSFLDENFNGVHDAGEPSGRICVAASYRLGRGSVMVFSDSSIFLNNMLSLGENSLLIEALTSGHTPYLLEDTLTFGAYTTLREKAVSSYLTFYNIMFYSSASYPLISLTAVLVFYVARALYFRLQKPLRAPTIKDKLYNTLRLHPRWDRRVLEDMLSEVFEGFERNRED